jgi:hypothetical protein
MSKSSAFFFFFCGFMCVWLVTLHITRLSVAFAVGQRWAAGRVFVYFCQHRVNEFETRRFCWCTATFRSFFFPTNKRLLNPAITSSPTGSNWICAQCLDTAYLLNLFFFFFFLPTRRARLVVLPSFCGLQVSSNYFCWSLCCRLLREGTLNDNLVVEGAKIILLPSVEAGLLVSPILFSCNTLSPIVVNFREVHR